MKKLLSAVLVLIAAMSHAQSIDKYVVSTAGNIQSKSTMVNSFTIGESLVMAMPKSTMEARNGFQQKTTGFGVSVKDIQLSSLSVFPNPFNSELMIQGPEINLVEEIILVSMTGQKMSFPTKPTNDQVILNTSQLAAGVYVLQIVQSSGVREFARIVKQ
jgi:hypothetical protein